MSSFKLDSRVAFAILLPCSVLSFPGCLQEIPLPPVGDCADYPDKAYDYGDIGIGQCLAAPADLRFNDGRLYVVNTNAYMMFQGGSLLSLDYSGLKTRLDEVREGYAGMTDDVELLPETILVSEADLGASAFALPNFGGRLAIRDLAGVDCAHASSELCRVGFVPSRLSDTVQSSIDDYVYTVDLSDPTQPEAFDAGNGDARILVGDDPFGTSGTDRHLFVVNETEHSVSTIDTTRYPLEALQSDRIGLISHPTFEDTADTSFAELAHLAVVEGVLNDTWHLKYNDGTYRSWYRPAGDDSLYWADSADGRTFRPAASSPMLEPGEAGAWDDGSIVGTSLLAFSDRYYFFYEALSSSGLRRLGLGLTSNGQVGSVNKVDLTEDGDTTNDFILEGGLSGTFDSDGVGSPWVTQRSDADYVLWYVGYQDDQTSLGASQSQDLLSWDEHTEVRFYSDYDEVAETYSGEVSPGNLRSPVGLYNGVADVFQLWFVQETDAGSCLVYAESATGPAEMRLGGLHRAPQSSPVCLDLPGGDDVHSPAISFDGRQYYLWYLSGSGRTDGSLIPHMVRGFDGISWFEDDGQVVMGAEGEVAFTEDASLLVSKLSYGYNFTLSGEVSGTLVGTLSPQVPSTTLTNSSGSNTLGLAVLYGHVLGAGSAGTITNAETYPDSLEPAAWDSQSVAEPAIDPQDGTLYYVGRDESGLAVPGAALPIESRGQTGASAWAWANGEAPLLTDDNGLTGPCPVRDNGRRFLYLAQLQADGSSRLVRSEYVNGTWTAPALMLEGLQGEQLLSPFVLPPVAGDPVWRMWFTLDSEGTTVIGYASSSDGETWTRAAESSLENGVPGTWDDEGVAAPTVVRRLDETGALERLELWFTGFNSISYRIGYAQAAAEPGIDGTELQWNTYEDPFNGGTIPTFENSPGWWDEDGVLNPSVSFDGEKYRMWYEGYRTDSGLTSRRVGLAESYDGIHWTRVFMPLDGGDAFVFRTASVERDSATADATGETSGIADGRLSLTTVVGSLGFRGIGASEVVVSPDQSIAVVAARYTAALYVIDVRDDSSEGFFDSNYLNYEALLTWQSNNEVEGARTVAFSPDGSKIFVTTAHPDSVMIFDRTRIDDRSYARVIDDALLDVLYLDAGLEEDLGASTSANVGAIGLAITRNGRYLFAGSANTNTVYTFDLEQGGGGEVIRMARDVGELPVALALSPDEQYLLVANYVGQVQTLEDKRNINHATLAVIDANDASPTFGRTLAHIKNLEP